MLPLSATSCAAPIAPCGYDPDVRRRPAGPTTTSRGASMSVHTLAKTPAQDPVHQAKVHLAAALRMAVLHELEEGIDNHFTVAVPGQPDRYLILPFGYHWSEARASDMIVFNEAGETVEGNGIVEISAKCIHAPIHRIAGVNVVLHTHQTWAVALNLLVDNRLLPTSQTSAFFAGQIAYDDGYNGLADTLEEGERLARLLGDNQVDRKSTRLNSSHVRISYAV